MNGLDTIIRDNLKWHARAIVAADQRGDWERGSALLAALPTNTNWIILEREYERAWAERCATRGL